MKNKKLFAILTLVCFMFTLMPVAAFATEEAIVLDDEQVYVVAADETVTEDSTELTVAPEEGFVASVGDEDAEGYVFYVVDEEGAYVAINRGGEFEGFEAEGDYTVYAIDVTADGTTYTNVDAVLAKIVSVESKVNDIKNWAGASKLVSGTAVVTVEDETEWSYAITITEYVKASEGYTAANNNLTAVEKDGVVVPGKWTTTIAANEGFKKDGKYIATLTKTAGDVTEVVKNANLTISKAGYITVDAADLKTDNKGQVVFEVTADYANNGNKVIVKYGTKAKAELTVNATNSTVAGVSVNNEPAAPQNIENAVQKANVEFKFVDVNGVAVELDQAAGVVADDQVAISIVEKPAKSNVKAADLKLYKQNEPGVSVDGDGVYTLKYVGGVDGEFDKEGTYVVKVALENGAVATATVKVAEMGDATQIIFVKAPTTVAYGESTFVGYVYAVDANGVTEPVSAELSASGLAIDVFYAEADDKDTADEADDIAKGTLVVEDDDKYIGSKITVLAVYEDFTATTDLVVVDKAKGIEYQSTKAEVGISTNLIGQIKDANGSVSAVNGAVEAKAIILSKPENAVAVANASYNAADKVVVLNFLASQAGEYEVQTVVTYGDNKFISSVETITVGGGVSTFKDVVVMSIGANKLVKNSEVKEIPTAPIIENGRTMVPLRALVEAFGAEVAWDETTQSVTVVLGETTVVMTINANAYTVNGVAKTADVAPFINADNFTMVPVRFVAQAFGITPTPIADATGAVVDVMFAK